MFAKKMMLLVCLKAMKTGHYAVLASRSVLDFYVRQRR